LYSAKFGLLSQPEMPAATTMHATRRAARARREFRIDILHPHLLMNIGSARTIKQTDDKKTTRVPTALYDRGLLIAWRCYQFYQFDFVGASQRTFPVLSVSFRLG
jgi:hypothetical protein